MLQSLHKYINGWLAGVLGFLVCAGFILMGLQYYINTASVKHSVLMKINGTPITENAVMQSYQHMAKHFQSNGGHLTLPVQKQLKAFALNQLIQQTALHTSLHSDGFAVMPAMITQAILHMQAFQVNGTFSPERYQQLLYRNGLSQRQFRQQFSQAIIAQQLQRALNKSAFVLPSEIQAAYKLSDQLRSFEYVLIKPRLADDYIINATALHNYYKNHLSDYHIPAAVKLSYLLLTPALVSKSVHIKAAQVQAYYNANKVNYRLPSRWQVNELLVSAPKGATHATFSAAKKQVKKIVSQLENGKPFKDFAIKQRTITQGEVSAVYQKILMAMTPGQISIPFQTKAGFHIIQLKRKVQGKSKPFAKMAPMIKRQLRMQKVSALLQNKVNILSNLTYTHPGTLLPAAKALGLTVTQSSWLAKTGRHHGVLSNIAVIDAAFSDDVLQQKNNSNVINLPKNNVLVLRVDHYRPAGVKSFSAVKTDVMKKLATLDAKKAAKLLAKQLLLQVRQGGQLTTLAKKDGLKFNTLKAVTRYSPQVSKTLLSLAFSAHKSGKFATLMQQMPTGAYAVVQLQKVRAPIGPVSAIHHAALTQALLHYHSQSYYQAFLKSVLLHASIKKYHKK